MPAFIGLGAPYWDPDARGAIVGLTRDTGPPRSRAPALEARRLPDPRPRRRDAPPTGRAAAASTVLRVDGGMVVNDWLLPVASPTSLGRPGRTPARSSRPPPSAPPTSRACAPASARDRDEIAPSWRSNAASSPRCRTENRDAGYAGWKDAVGGRWQDDHSVWLFHFISRDSQNEVVRNGR